ncbi:MAG: SpoIIE family protein phosphatase [Gammaproteobacteria bacterium]|nr:SpoIIE family protein phosphatase [Gammaproteobacteria bacterium]MDH5799334.1 SpoIIE family protein phosphatase [Gammaproteobacteria bacterium]
MNILVVDDTRLNRTFLKKILSKKYNVIEAENGPKAIEIVQEQDVDLILMDIMMPGMDGRTCASKIKQLSGDNYIPIIFVTALTAEETLSKALDSGGDDFISKPVNLEHLESKIAAHRRIRELYIQLQHTNKKLLENNMHLEREQELVTYFFDNALSHSYQNPDCVRHHISPQSAFNGDVLFVARRPMGGIYAILGDFTGHGLSAAMGTVPAAQTFYNTTKLGLPISEIVRELNKHLFDLLPIEMFLAAVAVEIDVAKQIMTVWSGAMPAAYIVKQKQCEIIPVQSQHLPLGVVPDEEFDMAVQLFELDGDEKFYVLTDGIIEACNADDDMYGDQRLQSIFEQFHEDVFDRVLGDLKSFKQGTDQDDDISFLEISMEHLPEEFDIDEKPQYVKHVPVNYQFLLNTKELRENDDPVTGIIDTIAVVPNIRFNRDILHTILSELYANALEHGVLELESVDKNTEEGFYQYYENRRQRLSQLEHGWIRVLVDYIPDPDKGDEVILRVQDSGGGFRSSGLAGVYSDLPSGRGIMLVSNVCESIQYLGSGNLVEAVFRCAA